MTGVIDSLERTQLRSVPDFQAGDRVKVHFQVVEGTRRRTQVFEGTVIKRQGSGSRETFTVRKQSFGVGVERTFPVHSPKIERIEVASRGDVRRAKLYYLRGRVGRRARVRERQFTGRLDPLAPALADEEEVLEDASGSQEEAPPAPPEADSELAGAEATDEAPAETAAAEEPAAEEPTADEPAAEAPADEGADEEPAAAEQSGDDADSEAKSS